MKLVEAMRKGREENPDLKQVRNGLMTVHNYEGLTHACAIGFALLGVLGREEVTRRHNPSVTAENLFPELKVELENGTGQLMRKIWHFNDKARLSVEEIADKVEGLLEKK